jgi:hypothetical protein
MSKNTQSKIQQEIDQLWNVYSDFIKCNQSKKAEITATCQACLVHADGVIKTIKQCKELDVKDQDGLTPLSNVTTMLQEIRTKAIHEKTLPVEYKKVQDKLSEVIKTLVTAGAKLDTVHSNTTRETNRQLVKEVNPELLVALEKLEKNKPTNVPKHR